MMNKIKAALPHLCIVISFMMFVFLIIDNVNSAMNFIDNDVFKILLTGFCVLVIALSVIVIVQHRRRDEGR